MLTIKDLILFLQQVRYKLNSTTYKSHDKEKLILLQAMKISEEIGEMNNELHKMMQKYSDGASYSKNLHYEICDVLLSTILLSIELDIDLEKALSEKMLIVDKRMKEI